VALLEAAVHLFFDSPDRCEAIVHQTHGESIVARHEKTQFLRARPFVSPSLRRPSTYVRAMTQLEGAMTFEP
jgi:hypothetical protein